MWAALAGPAWQQNEGRLVVAAWRVSDNLRRVVRVGAVTISKEGVCFWAVEGRYRVLVVAVQTLIAGSESSSSQVEQSMYCNGICCAQLLRAVVLASVLTC